MTDWGPWRLDAAGRYLVIEDPASYEIELDDCTTSAKLLDRVCQVASKTWADDAVVAGLVRALNNVLRPQANLCSQGASTAMTTAQIAALVDRAVERGAPLLPADSTAG